MRVMHDNIFTPVVCMNDYIITIQTFTNLGKKTIVPQRSPSMQRLVRDPHNTPCSRSVVAFYILALYYSTLPLAIVRKQRVC